MTRLIIFILSLILSAPALYAWKTPTMGWSSWNTFHTKINENNIKQQADLLVSTGLADAGYKYVNIDDGYWNGRDSVTGVVRYNTKLFPNGMRALADYIHSKGLKAGIYSDAGTFSCASNGGRNKWGKDIGFCGHEAVDAKTYFDDWDYDFVKVDYCGGYYKDMDTRERYTAISHAIRQCKKKDITYNICRWAYPGTWISEVADSWRTTGDIYHQWHSIKKIILENLYMQAYTGGGHYNDMDMLEIGNGDLTYDECVTHMAYWCITGSPLLIGCDLSKVDPTMLELMKNKDLIAMNQDKLGLGAPVCQREGEVYVVAKDLEKIFGPKRAVVIMNTTDNAQTINVSIDRLGFTGAVKLYDCLTHRPLASRPTGSFKVTLPAHGSKAYFATGKRKEKTLYQAEEAWMHDYQEIEFATTALYVPGEEADGGQYVCSLGHAPSNYLEWRNVYSEKGGFYRLRFRYCTGDKRDMTVQVGGRTVARLSGLCSGGWTKWQTVDVEAPLQKGNNVVRISNEKDWTPNLDCLTLIKL